MNLSLSFHDFLQVFTANRWIVVSYLHSTLSWNTSMLDAQSLFLYNMLYFCSKGVGLVLHGMSSLLRWLHLLRSFMQYILCLLILCERFTCWQWFSHIEGEILILLRITYRVVVYLLRFTKDGVLAEGIFWDDVESLLDEYENESRKSKWEQWTRRNVLNLIVQTQLFAKYCFATPFIWHSHRNCQRNQSF